MSRLNLYRNRRAFSLLNFFIISFLVPSLLAYPLTDSPRLLTAHTETSQSHTLVKGYEKIPIRELFQLIDDIENDHLEDKADLATLNRITYTLSNLARQGTPDDPYRQSELDEDIRGLTDFYNCANICDNNASADFTFWRATTDDQYEILPCKSWFKKKCSKVKQFTKKHKKAIIIGIVVVAVVVTVVIVVATAGTAAAPAAGLAGAGSGASATGATTATGVGAGAVGAGIAAAANSSDKSSSDTPNQEELTSNASATPMREESISQKAVVRALEEAPELSKKVEDMVTSLDNGLDLIPLPENPTSEQERTWKQEAKEFASRMVHEAIYEISDLVSIGPELIKEALSISQTLMHNEHESVLHDPVETHEQTVAALHEGTDKLFNTNFAENYTPEAKANDPRNNLNYMELPPPGGWKIPKRIDRSAKASINIQRLIEKGKAPKTVERFDKARVPYEKDHIHFKDGSALNFDGTWKHGKKKLTKQEEQWLLQNDWSLPKGE